MAITDPHHWFLGPEQTPRRPHFTTGNAGAAFIDGMDYMADLRTAISACTGSLLISGWRVSGEQLLNPRLERGEIVGDSFVDAVKAAAARGCSVKALLFNVPGTQMPGPFRIWHAKDNFEFAKAVRAAGGEAILDSRLALVPASAHHQKFIVSTSRTDDRHVAYVGGIDICLDRWDRAAHDAAPERQADHMDIGAIETHTASQPGWHDVQVRVQGPVVEQIWQSFRDRWNDQRPANHDPLLGDFRGGKPMADAPHAAGQLGTLAVQVNQTLPAGMFPQHGGPGETTVAKAHERAIDLAAHYIYVEDQYVWPCSLVERLEAALRRGVHVIMVVARDYDAPGLAIIAKRLRLQVAERLQRVGGDRFHMFHVERSDGKQIYVHSKVIIVDDCYASIGSANFNARSLTNDTELQLGIVDTDLITVPIAATPQTVCRFAHELRCRLWAEHLECSTQAVADPIAAIRVMWSRAPIAPSKRAHRHIVKPGLMIIDPIAEYVTTLITTKLAAVPFVLLPPGIDERSVVKLAVDAFLRGPQAALLLKFLEEMLNPDVAPITGALPSMLSFFHKPTGRDRPAPTSAEANEQQLVSEQILQKLRKGQMPQMVDWFDPVLLVRIGIRDIISGTIGQYADQRLMQAASDAVRSESELVARYDYSNPADPDPKKRVATDRDGAVWIDYVADLGDGFEATYAVAHLMAQDELEVRGVAADGGAAALPAGQILLMGGDQCYPQGTQQEYERRLIDPYTCAFTTDDPQRKLFAIPGNHDWYDGLSAFSSVFTSARDRISGGIGRQIGGWRCHQHRSYFALKLPHDWWIWGPDIQLEGNLDDPQRDYFDIVSDHTRPGDKIIICLAEPSWHHQDYDNLHEISMLARKHGAKIYAVIAGDWHHYSRYANPELGVQFITCGGGGAFAHATHQLKRDLELQWVDVTQEDHRVAEADDPLSFNKMEARIVNAEDKVDFTLKDVSISAAGGDETPGESSKTAYDKPARRPLRWDEKAKARIKRYRYHAPRIYPSRAKSRLLGLKNLLLPLRNHHFALFVGCIYFLYAWVFEVSAPKLDTTALSIPKTTPTAAQAQEALTNIAKFFWQSISPSRVVSAVRGSPAFFFMLLGLWVGLIYYVDLGRGFLNTILKVVLGSVHFFAHLTALLVISLAALIPTLIVSAIVGGSFQFIGLTSESTLAKSIMEIVFMANYALMSILIGGFIGALIMGVYWTITSLLFNMHCGDAFSALMIRDYKHFLRMRFEPDRLTIYPIAIDKVPGRRGWRVPTTEERLASPSQIMPTRPLDPHLIEAPIVIEVSAVKG